MLGAFHAELALVNEQKLKVYLLDMNMQNPTVQNSVLEPAVKISTWKSIYSYKA
jgi:hypothetical protein